MSNQPTNLPNKQTNNKKQKKKNKTKQNNSRWKCALLHLMHVGFLYSGWFSFFAW